MFFLLGGLWGAALERIVSWARSTRREVRFDAERFAPNEEFPRGHGHPAWRNHDLIGKPYEDFTKEG